MSLNGQTCCSDQVRGSLLLTLKLAHNLISCTTAFHNRPLVTFISKIHLSSADQKLSWVERQVGSSSISQVWNPEDLVQSVATDTSSGHANGKKRAGLRLAHPPEQSGLCPWGSHT